MTPLLESLELEIPENIRMTYRRMLYRTPRDIREDSEFQHKLLTFLKLGNETAARQYIAIQKVKLIEQLSLIKRHARDVVEVHPPDEAVEASEVDTEGDAEPAGESDAAAGAEENGDSGDEVNAAAAETVPQDQTVAPDETGDQAAEAGNPES